VVGCVSPGAAVLRSGAREGDVVAVTGRLGGSFPGRHLTFTPRVAEARSLVLSGPPTAMMDLSDGLALDLRRLCDASGLGADIDAAEIPIHEDVADDPDPLRRALGDGEDYELLFTVDPTRWDALAAGWNHAVPLSRIGRMTRGPLRLVTAGGVAVPWPRGGHVHH
jgi:thiamine-monophosphate kinase